MKSLFSSVNGETKFNFDSNIKSKSEEYYQTNKDKYISNNNDNLKLAGWNPNDIMCV